MKISACDRKVGVNVSETAGRLWIRATETDGGNIIVTVVDHLEESYNVGERDNPVWAKRATYVVPGSQESLSPARKQQLKNECTRILGLINRDAKSVDDIQAEMAKMFEEFGMVPTLNQSPYVPRGQTRRIDRAGSHIVDGDWDPRVD